MIQTWFRRVVLARAWLTFVILGLSFFVFGVGSLNLFYLLRANTQLLVAYGWQAALDGGLQQFLELLVTGYSSMAAYVVFKACEHALVDRLNGSHGLAHPPDAAQPSRLEQPTAATGAGGAPSEP